MGVFQSTVHFDNLTAVIDNHSPYEIKFRVQRPGSSSNPKPSQQNWLLPLSQTTISEKSAYLNNGSVSPYCTKYYELKDIQAEYSFAVYAIRTDENKKQTEVQLENNLKILSQNTVCIRVTSDLKVVHLTNEEIQVLKKRKSVESIFWKDSHILRTQELNQRLVKLFVECPSSTKLLFRASENNFDLRQFYNQFGNVKNVLLVCKTNNDKIIGGYSRQPLIHPEQAKIDGDGWRCIKDKTNSSFIYSLNTGDAFRLKEGQNALFYNKNDEQICFGSDELRINNHSDRNSCLSQNFNTNYQNLNYNNDPESYKLFNGNQSAEFTTKEWEAWRIYYENESQNQQDSV